MLTRRQLLQRGAIGAAVLAAPAGAALAGPAGLLAGSAAAAPGTNRPNLRLFAAPCPTPGGAWPVIDLRATSATTLDVREGMVSIHPDLPATTVWSYEPTEGASSARSTYLGPTIVAQRGTPVDVTYRNHLPPSPLFPTDAALVPPHTEECRIHTHLHGGRILDTEDGNPFDAFAGGTPEVHRGESRSHRYANEQGGALLWYHDHALGVTRTNVYAGLAGGYLLVEPAGSEDAVRNVPTAFDLSDVPDPYAPGFIPLHLPLVLQDKTLDASGRLLYPHPWTPEFFGTTCLVNGKALPYLDVQPRKYRFTILNGSQSRFYNLVLNKRDVPVTQIGVDLGPIDSPQRVSNILLGPAERADVIVDFSKQALGTKVVLIDAVLPAGVVSPTRPLGDCMQFRVVEGDLANGPRVPDFGDPALPGWTGSSPTPRPDAGHVVNSGNPSKVTLEEVMGRGGKPMMAVVNGAPFMQRAGDVMTHVPDPPFRTEVIEDGSTVEWLYLNLTADSHPFHTHLAHFEVVDRQTFDAVAYAQALHAARADAAPGRLDPEDYPDPRDPAFAPGPVVPAPPRERGPKDTVIANPGELTRIRLRFDLPHDGVRGAGPSEHRYVYHCHILEHEENEMMRPLLVTRSATGKA